MMKRTVGAGGLFLGASRRGLSKLTGVCTLSVAVNLGRFLELAALSQKEEGWEED